MSTKDFNGAPAPYHRYSPLFNQRTAANCASHLIPHIKPHHRILDIGCGPGSITLDLARLVPNGSVLGIDINADSIATATASAKEQGVTNVEFHEQDVMGLSRYESESFDIVHAHQLLLHLSQPLEVMREMRRLLKPGGVFATRDNANRIVTPPLPDIMKAIERHDRLARSRGTDPEFGRRNHVVAHEAGFGWARIETSSWGWEWSGEESRKMFVAGAKGTRSSMVQNGFATDDECDEFDASWEEWGCKPEGRFMAVDSALLCWK